MGRSLPPGEAEKRRKKRSQRSWERMRTGVAYKKYDPGDGIGYGNEAQWRAAAGGGFTLGDDDQPRPKITADIQTLGLTAMPKDAAVLKTAFRKASFVAHPDYGGSDAAFIALKQAYARLFEQLSQ